MRTIVLTLFALCWPVLVFSQFGQREQEPDTDVRELPVKERIFVGGFIGLQFGNYTSVGVNAHAGYRLTNRLSAGFGGVYQFANDRWFGESFTSHMYGGGVFARFRVFDQLFVHAEHEWLSLVSRIDFSDPGNRQRISEDNFLLGLGYGVRMSERVRLNLLLLYNFNEDTQVYFNNPFFRVGIDVYLR